MSVIIHSKLSGTPYNEVYKELLPNHPELADLPEHGLVHRLDTGTSGCLAFARDLSTYTFLRQCFKNGHPDLIKQYQAVVVVPADFILKTPMTIDWPIARLKKTDKRVKVLTKPTHTVGIRGEPRAVRTDILEQTDLTESVLKNLNLNMNDNDLKLVRILQLKIQIHTGFMHQIRAHLSALGAGILGDPVYPLTKTIRDHTGLYELLKPERFSRFFLHASFLQLPLPNSFPDSFPNEKTVSRTIPWEPITS